MGGDFVKVILKVEPHCCGCVSQIVHLLEGFKGVEYVKTEWESSKVIVVGNIDPVTIRDDLADKTKKNVDLVSPIPPPKKNPKEPTVTTAVLKVSLHCQGCIDKIQKILKKTDGIYYKDIDRKKDLVTVKGTMDAKALAYSLKKTLSRSVEIKKDNEGGANAPKMEYAFGYAPYPYPHPCPQCQSVNFYPLHHPQTSLDENRNACVIM